jgi:hypothetical protein
VPAYEEPTKPEPDDVEKDREEALAKKLRLSKKPRDIASNISQRTSPDGQATFPRSKKERDELETLAQSFDPSFDEEEPIDKDWVFNPETTDHKNMPENYEDYLSGN